MVESVDEAREKAIKRERVHLFFRTRYIPYLGGLRVLQALSVGGALYTGFLVWLLCDLPTISVAAYGSAVMVAETLVTGINYAFQQFRPADDRLWRWGWAKTVLCGLVAAAWSLGPVMLHVPSAPSSVLIPVTALIYFVTASSGMVGADYAPCMVVFAFSAVLPSAIWLITFDPGAGVEHTAGLCLLALLPCMAATGSIALTKSRIGIENRLDIAELLEVKARQAQQIEELFAERTRFFSAASHDLRQPLNAMGMYFELLARSPSRTDRDDILDRLRDCAGSLMRQFDAIMEVAATDADIRNVNINAMPVSEIFERVLSTLDLEARKKKISLRVAPTGLHVHADPALLERVLLNLVGNAIKYTDRGSVLLGARPRGSRVQVWVLDTGIGIDSKHINSIFDDFYQVDNPERNRDKGLGIGLAVVRRLSFAMGWEIEVSSKLGHGTVFKLSIPKADPPILQPDLTVPETMRRDGDTPIVVVIDDDHGTRDSLQRLLKQWGCECFVFDGGEAAIAFLEKLAVRKPCLILLDYRLARGETGFSVADRISLLGLDRARISLMTGDIGTDIAEGAKQRGLVVMRKPIQPIRLNALLRSSAEPSIVQGKRRQSKSEVSSC